MGKVYAVFSPTGGVGVSTIAAHLAYVLAASSETAIVDVVPDFGAITDIFGFTPKWSTGKFPLLFGPESHVMAELALPKRKRLKLFHMPPDLVSNPIDWKAFFSSSRKSFAYTILDLPHTFLAPELTVGLASADQIFVIGEYHWATILQLKVFFDNCEDKVEQNCKVLINRVEWLPEDVLAECKVNLNQPVFAELPYEAPLDGVRELRDHSVFGAALKRMVKEMHAEAVK